MFNLTSEKTNIWKFYCRFCSLTTNTPYTNSGAYITELYKAYKECLQKIKDEEVKDDLFISNKKMDKVKFSTSDVHFSDAPKEAFLDKLKAFRDTNREPADKESSRVLMNTMLR